MEIKYDSHPSQLKRATNIFSTEIIKDRADVYKVDIENNEVNSNNN